MTAGDAPVLYLIGLHWHDDRNDSIHPYLISTITDLYHFFSVAWSRCLLPPGSYFKEVEVKVEGLRVIPLTPFCESLLDWLPKRNEWVFSSPAAKFGKLQEPIRAHKRALAIVLVRRANDSRPAAVFWLFIGVG
jgi:hypothetical protein